MSRHFLCLSVFVAATLISAPSCAHTQISEQTPSAAQTFEVASVKLSAPEGERNFSTSPLGAPYFFARNSPVAYLIGRAYHVDQYQVLGRPDWFTSQLYDVSAKGPANGELSDEALESMLQRLLKERFNLAFHRETKEFKGYALVVDKAGPKLTASKVNNQGRAKITLLSNELRMDGVPLWTLASLLGHSVGRPVADKTGLQGTFDIQLKFAPEGSQGSELPSMFTALQEQLGLKLQPDQVSVEMFVIDHLDRVPTPD